MPPADKLGAFLRAANTLDVEVVGGVVLDQLGEESWQVRYPLSLILSSLCLCLDQLGQVGALPLILCLLCLCLDQLGEEESWQV